MNGRELLTAGRLMARKLAPYLRTLLLSFEVREAKGLGTVGCTKRGILLVDFEWLAKFSPEQVAGLLLHECMHRLNVHFDRVGSRDPVLWNLAGDRAINPAVLKMGAKLPDGDDAGVFPSDLSMADGLTADAYYLEQKKRGGKGGSGNGKGTGKPKVCGGWCGSCAGRPLPGEPTDGRSDGELVRINMRTAEAIREHAAGKGRGTVPTDLLRWAEDMLKPAVVPWRTKLRQVVRYGVAWRAGAVEHRWDGPGRRQAGLGYGRGRPVMPRLRAPIPNVAVVIDTSGSMGIDELSRAASETDAILREINATITICTIDAAVHGLRSVRTIKEAAAMFRGGGGTSFIPAFEILSKQRPRPEILVYCTDGCGPAPEVQPSWCKTIWVLVGKHRQIPCLWGQVVEVDERDES